MRKNKSHLKHAFTLIELMIVVVIIAILVAIGVPSYQTYLVKSKISEAYTMMASIGNSQISYFHENGEFFNLATNNPLYLDEPMVVISDPEYDQFGYFSSIGSRVYFSYRSPSGKVNSSGTELTAAGDSVSGLGFSAVASDDLIEGKYSLGATCNESALTPSSLGVIVTPSYHWSILGAVADLNHDEGSTCTAIVRVLEASGATENKPTFSGGFIVFNEGS